MSQAERSRGWDELHRSPRYRPAYPSEPVVRFVSRHLGGITEPAERSARVLDLGCGAGRHSVMLARAGHRPFATDRSITGLAHATEGVAGAGARLQPAVADSTALPFADEAFDGLIAYGVVNYNTRTGLQLAIDEIRRVLRPGGWAQVVTRTTDDHRAGAGREVEPGTFVLDIEETSEPGMLMHFLDRDDVTEVFQRFSELVVDRIDFTSGGGAVQNSDWVIEARR
jgi:SAM-dependent methyltransferase